MSVYRQYCIISDDAVIGLNTRVGNFVFIRDRTVIGDHCLIGSYSDIEGDVRIGNFVALQSGCYLTRGVIFGSEGFGVPARWLLKARKICTRRPWLRLIPRAHPSLRPAWF